MKRISGSSSYLLLPFVKKLVGGLALLLACASPAYAVDHYVTYPGAGVDATANIQAALNNTTYDRVILSYQASGWTTQPLFMNAADQELWIAGSGSNSNKLLAKTGAFIGTTDCLIKVQASGCTINGYNNGTNTANGIALLQMNRAAYAASPYTASDQRHGIRSDQDNLAIKGVNIKDTGGDGIYISGGTTLLVDDVTCDASYRSGMTVVKAASLAISDSTFKNSIYQSPQAGIAFQPNTGTDAITSTTVTNCTITGNATRQVLVNLANSTSGGTVGIYVYTTTMSGGLTGIWMQGMKSTGPTGTVYFQDSDVTTSTREGIRVQDWASAKASAVFNRVDINNCGTSGSSYVPFLIQDSGATSKIGNIHFQNYCRIDDHVSGHPYIIGGTSSYGFEDITGTEAVDVKRHYSHGLKPIISFAAPISPIHTNLLAWP
jgi:hypothetical protein